MSILDYGPLRAAVVDGLAFAGDPGLVGRPGATSGPDWAPVPGVETFQRVTVVGADRFIRDAAGSLMTDQGLRITISTDGVPAGWRPEKGDRVLVPLTGDGTVAVSEGGNSYNGEWYEILAVKAIAPAEMTLAWKAELRR